MQLRKILSVLSLTLVGQTFAIDKVVYGPDDRLDLFEVSNQLHLELAKSTAAMIEQDKLSLEDGQYNISGISLKSRGICESERFADQLTTANCSGFLVTKDLLVTAGHCVRSARDCQANAWVFDYKQDGPDQVENKVPKESVYKCVEIVQQVLETYDSGNDFALIRLDREVKDREPLKVRTEGKVEVKAPLVVIGHPTGLPTKVADNAWVRSNDELYFFVANLDTFGGNSGSAVFDSVSGLVEGILVRGETDYEYDFSRGCRKPKQCDDEGCRGEDVTRITNVTKLMEILRQSDDSAVVTASTNPETNL